MTLPEVEFSVYGNSKSKSVCWLNNHSIVTGSYDEENNSLTIWKIIENKLKSCQIIKHLGESNDIKVHNEEIYSASSNGMVYKYSKKDNIDGEYKLVETFKVHENECTTSLDICHSNLSLIAGSEDGYVNIFSSKFGDKKIKADSLPIHCVRFQNSSGSSRFLTTSTSIKIWDLNQSNSKSIHQLTK